MRPTAKLTSWSSPVSATKSIQTSRPSRSVRAPPGAEAPRTWHTRLRSPAAPSGRIQSRTSSWLLAAATARRCRRWPARAVIPNQRIARGLCAPRWKRPNLVGTRRGSIGRKTNIASSYSCCKHRKLLSSPDKWNQPVPNSLRIGVVAFQLSLQEPFLDQDPNNDHRDRNARQQCGCARFQPQRQADHQEDGPRVHRMSHYAVDSGIDHRLMSLFLMFHHWRREGVLPENE